MKKGKQSYEPDIPVYIGGNACVVGKKEYEGPLGKMFDMVVEDPMFGEDSWEKAESKLIELTVEKLFIKTGYKSDDIRYAFAGDLLGQITATTFGLEKFSIPLFGLYGACSTFGESMSLAVMSLCCGAADRTMAVASSHFAGAEKQFRFPLDYGNQRPRSSTWTVTGCGAVVLTSQTSEMKNIRITGITTGKIIDYGVRDSMNMGAAMAPAAADLIMSNIRDFGIKPDFYDAIITGDLGMVGRTILLDILSEKGIDISGFYRDCGIEIFDSGTQNTQSGGSGCGCSAVTFCSYICDRISSGIWKKVLFIPTGALLSTVSFNEGNTIPGIAHGIMLEYSE